MQEQYARDKAILQTRVVSMDVEEIRVSHYDWMKMTGELLMKTRSEPLKTRLVSDCLSGFNDDKSLCFTLISFKLIQFELPISNDGFQRSWRPTVFL